MNRLNVLAAVTLAALVVTASAGCEDQPLDDGTGVEQETEALTSIGQVPADPEEGPLAALNCAGSTYYFQWQCVPNAAGTLVSKKVEVGRQSRSCGNILGPLSGIKTNCFLQDYTTTCGGGGFGSCADNSDFECPPPPANQCTLSTGPASPK